MLFFLRCVSQDCAALSSTICLISHSFFFPDADIEDNIESDAVRQQNRHQRLQGGEATTAAEQETSHTQHRKISDSKMTLINGLAFCGIDLALESAAGRMSKSDSELCTQNTASGAKRSDSTLDVDSLTASVSSMGISNDTSATLKSASNDDVTKPRSEVTDTKEEELNTKEDTSSLQLNGATVLPKQTARSK